MKENEILRKIPEYEPLKKIAELKRIDGKQRFYIAEGFEYKMPSVTTILDSTNYEKKQKLKEWKKRVGEAKAYEITKESAGIGTAFHYLLEHLLKNRRLMLKNNYAHKKAFPLVETIINSEIINWNKTLGIEYKIFYPKLYAGTIDIIFEENGNTVIGDFKTARKMKKEEHIMDYKLQLTAYKYALEHHGIKIDYGKIMMMSYDGDFQTFIITEKEFKQLKNIWFGEKIIEFFNKFLKEE